MPRSFRPPEAVARAAARGLELRRRHGRGGTAVGVARARDLSNRRPVSVRTLKRMRSYFARHAVDARAPGWRDAEQPSAGWIAWLLWGGDAGRAWALGQRTPEENPRREIMSTRRNPVSAEYGSLKPYPGLKYRSNGVPSEVDRVAADGVYYHNTSGPYAGEPMFEPWAQWRQYAHAYPEWATRSGAKKNPRGNPLTARLRSRPGMEVLAKLYKGEPQAKTFANRTQARRAQEEAGEGWAVYQFGRPFYVGRWVGAQEGQRRNPSRRRRNHWALPLAVGATAGATAMHMAHKTGLMHNPGMKPAEARKAGARAYSPRVNMDEAAARFLRGIDAGLDERLTLERAFIKGWLAQHAFVRDRLTPYAKAARKGSTRRRNPDASYAAVVKRMILGILLAHPGALSTGSVEFYLGRHGTYPGADLLRVYLQDLRRAGSIESPARGMWQANEATAGTRLNPSRRRR